MECELVDRYIPDRPEIIGNFKRWATSIEDLQRRTKCIIGIFRYEGSLDAHRRRSQYTQV
jgi:hypothetical protein